MKKFYVVLGAMLMVTAVSAQRAQKQHDFNATYEVATPEEAARAIRQGNDLKAQNLHSGERVVFFTEDFANGLDGNNEIDGAWTVEDTGGGSIFMMADASSPAGEFSTNIGALESTTAANGWVIFDADAYNTPVDDGVEDVEGFLTSPMMDMSALESVIVDWEQYFRYCCFDFAPVFLEVSNDAGATWLTFPGKGDFIESANDASANPLPTSVDISCAAAGQEEVMIRFSYLQNPIVGNGYSHYYWGIDDIVISSLEVENDLEVAQVSTGDIFNFFEYVTLPLEQASSAADGGLVSGVIYKNVGFADQTNVVITVDVLDSDDAIVATVSTEPFTYLSAANSLVCPSQAQDTVYLETGFVPSAEATFTVRATITSDEVDEFEDSNVRSRDITYNSDEYAHESNENWDTEFRPRDTDAGDAFEPTGYGNYYLAQNEGTMAYGALVAFGENTANNAGDFVEFELRFYTLEPGIALNDANFEAAFHNTVPEWVPSANADAEFVYFAFEEPIEMQVASPADGFDDDVFHFVAIVNDFESETELTVVGVAGSDTDNSSGVLQQSGAGDFIWFGDPSTPAVRLITSERVGIDELANLNGVDVKQNVPNPANNTTMIELFLVSSRTVSFEVRDLAGRLIETREMGQLPSGETRITLDVNNYNAGMYTYTFIVDGLRLTKKMIVN